MAETRDWAQISFGVSTGGNTAGTTGMANNAALFYGGANITLSQSTAPNCASITIVGGGGAGFTGGVSTSGNTAGTTGTVSNGLLLVGGTNITLSQSSGAGGATVSIVGGAGGGGGTLSQWMPPGVGFSTFSQMGQGSLVMFPAQLQANGVFSRADFFGSASVSTSNASSFAGTLSLLAGIYTRNASTLSLATSGSQSHSWNISNNSSSSYTGLRAFTVPLAATMTPGEYFFGVISLTTSTNANWFTLSNVALEGFNVSYAGPFGSSNNASNQFVAGAGVFSATTNALPASVAFSGLVATSAATVRPIVNLINYTA